MPFTRRDVLRATALGVAAAACGGTRSSSAPVAKPVAKKKLLILGGTGFLGPATIEAALARGHEITIFNRGKREKTRPLAVKVEHLYGNRDPELDADDKKQGEGASGSPRGLEQLAGRTWDCVIDNSGFFPRHVTASAKLLADHAAQYIYISSISAYDGAPPAGGDETFKLATLADPTVETMGDQFQNYGGLKALCEQAASAQFGARATIVRPGYIVGPGDPTDRFTYWPIRIARGGEVLAPGAPTDPVQWIDVRDLAEWLVHLAETATAGTFNALGPAQPTTWGSVLDTCVAATPGAKLVWVPTEWLVKHSTEEDAGFPIWAPPVGDTAGFHRWSTQRSTAAGLTFRSTSDTVKALLAWYPADVETRVRITNELIAAAKAEGKEPPKMAPPDKLRAGPSPEDEARLIAAFRAG